MNIIDEDDTGGAFDDGVSDWVDNDHGIQQRSWRSSSWVNICSRATS